MEFEEYLVLITIGALGYAFIIKFLGVFLNSLI